MNRRKNWVITGFAVMHNRNRKNWAATDLTKLTRMYRSGRLSVKQIANRLNRTYSAVVKKAERMGLTFKKKK